MFGELNGNVTGDMKTAIEFAKYTPCTRFLEALRDQLADGGALETLISQPQGGGKVYSLTARQLFNATLQLYSRTSFLKNGCNLAVGRNQLDTILFEMVRAPASPSLWCRPRHRSPSRTRSWKGTARWSWAPRSTRTLPCTCNC